MNHKLAQWNHDVDLRDVIKRLVRASHARRTLTWLSTSWLKRESWINESNSTSTRMCVSLTTRASRLPGSTRPAAQQRDKEHRMDRRRFLCQITAATAAGAAASLELASVAVPREARDNPPLEGETRSVTDSGKGFPGLPRPARLAGILPGPNWGTPAL